MNFRYFEKRKSRSGVISLISLVVALSVFTVTADAQRGRKVWQTPTPIVSSPAEILAPVAGGATQCQDGKLGSPVACAGNAYKTGSLNRNNSHYFEGDSIPYQITLSAPANSVGNTVVLNYDSTKAGAHALDFLTSFDRTESVGNDPCTGTGADCALKTTFAIPNDPDLTNQIAGVFTMYGGTITGASAYTLSGSYAGDSTRSITLTFSMGPNAGVAILAVGGHAATRKDWGNGKGAVNITGSPFHFDTGGNNLQVTVGALTAQATINIIKLVHNLNGTQSNPTASFGFISNGGPLGNFSLVDNDPTANGGGVKTGTTTNIGTSFTVAEDLAHMPGKYTFTQGGCVIDPAGFPNNSTATAVIGVDTVATIVPGEGNTITCTYENGGSNTTAAQVTIGGRIVTADGRGISGARISMIDDQGMTRTATSNRFGYYSFDDVEVGRGYVIGAAARGVTFTSKLIGLTSALNNIDFVAN